MSYRVTLSQLFQHSRLFLELHVLTCHMFHFLDITLGSCFMGISLCCQEVLCELGSAAKDFLIGIPDLLCSLESHPASSQVESRPQDEGAVCALCVFTGIYFYRASHRRIRQEQICGDLLVGLFINR